MDLGHRNTHNHGPAHVRSNDWGGLAVYSIHQELRAGRTWHEFDCLDPILSVIINEVGGSCELRPEVGACGQADRRARVGGGHASLIPAGMHLWGYSDEITALDEVRIMLDPARVAEMLGDDAAGPALEQPRLMFLDHATMSLAIMLARHSGDGEAVALLGDSLVTAIVTRFTALAAPHARSQRRLGLSRRQIAMVSDYMLDNLARPIRLSELAALAELSSSQFGRAFKVSTGMTPHQWHIDARISFSKRLLREGKTSMVDVALDTGFADQAHFSRTFRLVVGVSPSAWKASALS